MNKKLIRKCPLCDSAYGEILHTQKFVLGEQNPLPKSYDVITCEKCGFGFADTSATQTDYDFYYSQMSKYEDTKTASGGGNTEFDANRLLETANTIANFVKNKNLSIADIGTGNGGLLDKLKQLGYNNLTAIDPSEKCCQLIQTKNINTICSSIFDIQIDKKFDFIILSHVLEHIYDITKAVNILTNLLNENGMLYIEVPDASLYTEYYIKPYHYFDIEHINHFDTDKLKDLQYKNNFLELVLTGEKTISVSSHNKYPACYIILRKRNTSNNYTIQYTDRIKQNMLKYIKLSKDNDPNAQLESIVLSQQPVIIWGAGAYTMRLLSNSNLKNTNILYFVDNDSKKVGQTIMGKEIKSPNVIKNDAGGGFLLSLLAQHYSDMKLKNKLKQWG